VWRFDPGPGGQGCVIKVEFMEDVSAGIAKSSADGVKRDAEKHIREMEEDVLSHLRNPHRETIVRRK
jgi:BMFP domain-containing protein YqiC